MACRCFSPLIDGMPANEGGGAPGSVVLRGVSHEIDWSAQASVVLTDGAHNIVDTRGIVIPHNTGSAAGAATFRLQNGSGLEFVANATSTVFTSASQTASHIYALYSALFTAWDVDPTWVLTVRNYFSIITIPTNAEAVQVGVWGIQNVPLSLASARTRMFRKSRSSGVFVAQFQIDTAASANRTGSTITASNVLGYTNANGTTSGLWGVFNGGWNDARITDEIALDATTSNNPNTFRDATVRNVVAFPTGGTAADMIVTLQRSRYDFVPLLAA